MFVYAARNYTSAVTLARPADVTCEKCSCRYRYKLVRRATGRSSAPYGLGAEGAKRRAQELAVKAVGRRLATGVDPVACPDCGWFQADMVRDLRRRAGRRTLHLAWAVPAVAAVVLFCLCAAESHGFRRSFDRMDAGGQMLVLAAAALVVLPPAGVPLLRLAVVRRIDPNRDYPIKPGPVPGVPPAVRVEDDGSVPVEWEPTSGPAADGTLGYGRREPDVLPGGWVTVQLLGLTCPPTCARCLGPSDHTARSGPLHLGLCARCDRPNWPGRLLAVAVGAVPAVVPLLFAVFWSDRFSQGGWVMATVFAAGFGGAIGGVVHHRSAGPVRQRRFDPARNTVELRFKNPGYTDLFRQHVRTTTRQAAVRALAPPPPLTAGQYVVNIPVRPNRKSQFKR